MSDSVWLQRLRVPAHTSISALTSSQAAAAAINEWKGNISLQESTTCFFLSDKKVSVSEYDICDGNRGTRRVMQAARGERHRARRTSVIKNLPLGSSKSIWLRSAGGNGPRRREGAEVLNRAPTHSLHDDSKYIIKRSKSQKGLRISTDE